MSACTACGGDSANCHHEMNEEELVCSVCKNEGEDAYDEWELTDGEPYCYKCVSEKYKDQPVPEEWRMPDE